MLHRHTHICTHAHTAVELQVRILVCAAKALCGSLKSRFFGRGEVFRRCLLLVRWVCFSLWHDLRRSLAVRRGLAGDWRWSWRLWGWRRKVTGKRVRIRDLINGLGFFHAPLLLALILLLALLQLWSRLRHLKYDGGVLLQVLASRRLGKHDDPSAVHPRGWFEIQLTAVLLPALQLSVVLPFHFSRRHWHLQNLRDRKRHITGSKLESLIYGSRNCVADSMFLPCLAIELKFWTLTSVNAKEPQGWRGCMVTHSQHNSSYKRPYCSPGQRLTQSSAQEPDTEQPAVYSISLCTTFILRVSAVSLTTLLNTRCSWVTQHSTISLSVLFHCNMTMSLSKNVLTKLEYMLWTSQPAVFDTIYLEKVGKNTFSFFWIDHL